MHATWFPALFIAAGKLNTEGLILLAIMVFLTFWFLRSIYMRRRTQANAKRINAERGSRPAVRPVRPGRTESYEDFHRFLTEMDRLTVELHEYGREIEGRLDTKIAYIKGLLDQADQAGARLENRIGRSTETESAAETASESESESASETETETETASESASDPASDPETASHPESGGRGSRRAVTTDTDRPSSPDHKNAPATETETLSGTGTGTRTGTSKKKAAKKPAKKSKKKPAKRTTPAAAAETPETPESPLTGQNLDVLVGADPIPASPATVISLHESGKNPSQIAEALKLPKGEVELMINLHQSQGERAD